MYRMALTLHFIGDFVVKRDATLLRTSLHNVTGCNYVMCIYITFFEAILILFIVIFEDDKSDNFLRGDKSLSNVKTQRVAPKQIKCHNVKASITSFQASLKVKTDIFVNVIYELIHLLLKYRKNFPRDLQIL